MGAVPPHYRPNTPKAMKVGVISQSVHPGEGAHEFGYDGEGSCLWFDSWHTRGMIAEHRARVKP